MPVRAIGQFSAVDAPAVAVPAEIVPQIGAPIGLIVRAFIDVPFMGDGG